MKLYPGCVHWSFLFPIGVLPNRGIIKLLLSVCASVSPEQYLKYGWSDSFDIGTQDDQPPWKDRVLSKFQNLHFLWNYAIFSVNFGVWVYVRNQISEMANWNRTKVVTHKHQGPRMMPVLSECQNNFDKVTEIWTLLFWGFFLIFEAISQRWWDL